jgi:hypothetical protein
MEITMTRRGACSLGIGMSAMAVLGGAPAYAALGERPKIDYVVTDGRHSESLEFAAGLAVGGARPLEVTAGLTRLWSDALLPLWRNGGGIIAGLTLSGTWSCLAEQGRSWGRRSILVGHHGMSPDGDEVEHRVEGPNALRPGFEALSRCGGDWPRIMAALALRCPIDASRPRISSYRSTDNAAPPASALVSWIIA